MDNPRDGWQETNPYPFFMQRFFVINSRRRRTNSSTSLTTNARRQQKIRRRVSDSCRAVANNITKYGFACTPFILTDRTRFRPNNSQTELLPFRFSRCLSYHSARWVKSEEYLRNDEGEKKSTKVSWWKLTGTIFGRIWPFRPGVANESSWDREQQETMDGYKRRGSPNHIITNVSLMV